MDGQRDEAMARVAAALRQALTRPTVHGLDGLLDPDVRWGGIEETEQTCHGRAQVLAFYSRLLEEGVSLEVRDLRVDGEHIRLQMRVRRPQTTAASTRSISPPSSRGGGTRSAWTGRFDVGCAIRDSNPEPAD